jgi:hypothetical protein
VTNTSSQSCRHDRHRTIVGKGADSTIVDLRTSTARIRIIKRIKELRAGISHDRAMRMSVPARFMKASASWSCATSSSSRKRIRV